MTNWQKSLSTVLLTLLLLQLGLTIVRGWKDDSEVLKWNPSWLTFKYSAPIGIRNRGDLFRGALKRTDENPFGYKRLPNFPPPPFEAKRSGVPVVQGNPYNRDQILGWYSGPGSLYHLADSAEEDNEPN
ncbi:unnamed protein product [Allacma fusca]|uniref:Uncharacterized protein n=1 Tax=Allacma fusca TaxID=39272 RepID=A0A8J2JQA9_9HEXA|nr:unnamed protein product [Allacma fusca]